MTDTRGEADNGPLSGDNAPERGEAPTGGSPTKGWFVDLTLGGLIGGIAGAIGAVNFVIWTGIEQGYEANLIEVFQHSLIAGLTTVVILIAGPVLGVVALRRLRRTRDRGGLTGHDHGTS